MNRLMTRLRREDNEAGIALAMVIGLGLVVTLLVATMLTSSLSGLQKSSTDTNASAALAAAYAGIEDYQSKLANDNTYVQYGNANSTFSNPVATVAVSTPAKSKFTSTNDNPAFGLGVSGSWADVDGSASRAKYRYEVDNSQYYLTGKIRLRSTGKVGKTVRTEIADLKQNGFINYLYFTDYEISDPSLFNAACGAPNGTTLRYDWQPGGHQSSCQEIQFGPNDDLQGPVHSNDSLLICGSTFENTVESGWNTTGTAYNKPSNCDAPTFTMKPNKVVYSPPITIPATNTSMKQETRYDLTGTTVPRPGCLYTGPTSIVFNDDGTMTVRSPWTKATQVSEDASFNDNGGQAPSACGTPGPGTVTNGTPQTSGTLGSLKGQTFPVPANNLIYVQAVPHTTSTNPNYYSNSLLNTQLPVGLTCAGGSGSSGTGNGIGYPMANEKAPSSTTAAPSYGCDSGDVFVQGTLQGQVTVAAANYVYITGDITYSKTNVATNMLGLVGQNAVWVYNPEKSSGTLIDTSKSNRTISAAILSVAHTFLVQNYDDGAKGNLIVNGSIAQEFRGPVGTAAGSGYTKVYQYDQRLRYTAPPKFLTPVSTSYGISTLTETKAAFTVDGTQVAG